MKDASDTPDIREATLPGDEPGLSAAGISAMQEGAEPLQPGEEFEIDDWTDYPDGPKPDGPFRLIDGEEYEQARADANAANLKLHQDNPDLQGQEIHEIKPVKFGGSPTDIDNKMALTRQQHQEYTKWWNRKLRDLTGS